MTVINFIRYLLDGNATIATTHEVHFNPPGDTASETNTKGLVKRLKTKVTQYSQKKVTEGNQCFFWGNISLLCSVM